MLAGGLVSVAAPAQADEMMCTWVNVAASEGGSPPPDYGTSPPDSTKPSDAEGIEKCNGAGLAFVRWEGRDEFGPMATGTRWRWYAYGIVAPETPEDLGGSVVGDDGVTYSSVTDPGTGDPVPPVVAFMVDGEPKWGVPVTEPVQETTPPPPCWDASINNCPVGGALRFTAPRYAMVGVPVTMYAYASWRPDANAPSQPTNGTAVIRVDGEDYSGVEFKDGIAEWRFIPETEGMKEFTASGVLFSGLSGANAYIDTVPARTYVLEYDPAAYATALKNKRVEVGDTYVVTDPNQARSYLEDRYEWSVSEKSDDVCAVYETKKGAVKAKFNGEGKCTVIWMDKESEEEGKYTFIAKK